MPRILSFNVCPCQEAAIICWLTIYLNTTAKIFPILKQVEFLLASIAEMFYTQEISTIVKGIIIVDHSLALIRKLIFQNAMIQWAKYQKSERNTILFSTDTRLSIWLLIMS